MRNPIFDFIEDGMPIEQIYGNMGFDWGYQLGIDALVEDELNEAYEDDTYNWLESWNPEIPEGYSLIGKFDTEEGPIAIWVKPITAFAAALLSWGFSEEAQAAMRATDTQRNAEFTAWVNSRLAQETTP